MIRLPRRFSAPVFAFALLASVLAPIAEGQQVLDGIAAVVNNEVVTFSQVRELVGPKEKTAHETLKGQELVEKVKEIRLQAVNDLIDRQLILQEFRELEKKGASIPEYVIEERIQAIIREEFGGDRAAFLRTLNAQGYTLERFRQLEKEKAIVQGMRSQQARGNVIVPEAKVREYYQQHLADYTSQAQTKLRMLVIKKDDSGDSRRKMIDEIREKILAGAEFAELARLYSEDSTQEQGGDWGWISEGTLNETLSKAAFKLKPGEVSKVLELGDNYYLLYCEAKKPQTTKPFTEVQAEIERTLVQAERQKAQQEWLAKLRKKAYIKIY